MSWRRIGTTSGYVMVGSVASQLLQYLIMISIAHREGPKMLGFYALAQALSIPIQYLSWLSIRQRYLTLQNSERFLSDFLVLRAVVPAAAFVFVLVCIIASGTDHTFALVCFFLFIIKYIEGFYDLIYGRMQKDGNARLLAKLSVTRCVISGAIFILSYNLTKSLFVAMFLTAVQQAAILFFVKGCLRGDITEFSDHFGAHDVLRRRWQTAVDLFPMALSLVLMSLNTSIPRFLLNGLLGARELGYFAAVCSFTALGGIAVSSLSQSLLPLLAAAIASKAEKSFWRQLAIPMLFLQAVCIIGAVVSYFFGSTLLQLVYGPAFKHIDAVLVAGVLSSGPYYAASLANAGLFAAHMKSGYFWSNLLAVVFNALGSLALVPAMGVNGVFLSSAVSACLQILLNVGMLRRFWARSALPRAVKMGVVT